MEDRLKIGKKARDFVLKDHRNENFKLSDFEGRRILLSFHPLAWTPVCARQMKALDENKSVFDSLNTLAVGLSVDTVPSKFAWANSLGITQTRLLSDFWPHGRVSKMYDLFRQDDGLSQRANVLIDENRTIRLVKIYETRELPTIQDVIRFIQNLK
ncbi:MAG: redoxin domain-containing protein [Methanomassiliicoccales archaeon]|nr:redoxin domain-containing protein [Methanomassiliicoccales archaeon]